MPVQASSRVLFGLFSGPPRCTRTYVEDGAGTSADRGPNILFTSALTLTALTLIRGIPRNSIKSRSSAERPIRAWAAGGPFGLGMDMATEAPKMGCTAAVVGALGMHRPSISMPTLRGTFSLLGRALPLGPLVRFSESNNSATFIFFFFSFFSILAALRALISTVLKPSSLLLVSSFVDSESASSTQNWLPLGGET